MQLQPAALDQDGAEAWFLSAAHDAQLSRIADAVFAAADSRRGGYRLAARRAASDGGATAPVATCPDIGFPAQRPSVAAYDLL
jgi:hypothetical protein